MTPTNSPVQPRSVNRQSLEQQRAQDAFDCSQACTSAYRNLAKSLPSLIMTSGLMPTLAFMEGKSDQHYKDLAKHLRLWLGKRFASSNSDMGYQKLMDLLTSASPDDFRALTTETMQWLKWLRQMADANCKGSE